MAITPTATSAIAVDTVNTRACAGSEARRGYASSTFSPRQPRAPSLARRHTVGTSHRQGVAATPALAAEVELDRLPELLGDIERLRGMRSRSSTCLNELLGVR